MSVKMRKIFLYLVVLVFCFQLISATDTNIQIKTVPNMNVNVLVLSPAFDVYDRFNADADEYGDVSFVFSSDKTRFGLTVFVKDLSDDSRVASKELRNLISGIDVYVEAIPTGFKIIETPVEENISIENSTLASNLTNETESNTTNVTTIIPGEEAKKKSKILGLVIFGENTDFKRIMIYVGGAIVLAIIVFFAFKFFKKRKRRVIKVTKLSDWKEEQKGTPREYYGILEEAQRKLEETQKELNMVKNKDKIKEIEEKLKRDEEELRKLKEF